MLNTYHDKFKNLYENYIIIINIKKIKAFKYKFNDSFTLYYHDINNSTNSNFNSSLGHIFFC